MASRQKQATLQCSVSVLNSNFEQLLDVQVNEHQRSKQIGSDAIVTGPICQSTMGISIDRLQGSTTESSLQGPLLHHDQPPNSEAVRLTVEKICCTGNCYNSSYDLQGNRLQNAFGLFMGCLFTGYKGITSIAHHCGPHVVRESLKKVTATYSFPLWFVERAYACTLAYLWFKYPEPPLQVVTVRQSFVFTLPFQNSSKRLNVASNIQSGLARRDISVSDVAPDGSTFLHVG